MKKSKIKAEIKNLLQGPGRPWMIYYSEGLSMVNYKDKPTEILNKAEADELIARYPGTPVYKVSFIDDQDVKA